jgi:hypothetical protein
MEGGVKVIEPFYLRLQCTIKFYHLFTPISMFFFSLWPGPNVIKTFYAFNLRIFEFVPGKPFRPSLMFASKARTYPSEALFQVLHSRVGL